MLPSAHPHAAELARGGHHDAVDAAAALRPAACHAAGQSHRQPAKDASGPRHQIHLDRRSSGRGSAKEGQNCVNSPLENVTNVITVPTEKPRMSGGAGGRQHK